MFTLTSFTSPSRSSAIRSRTGETAWHGPHHSAQKSTITGVSLLMTSVSNVDSVTAGAIRVLSSLQSVAFQETSERPSVFPPYNRPHVRTVAGQARPPGARARHARALGARGYLRAASRPQPGRPDLELRGRPRHREQDPRSAHGLGPDAEGRVPALQGAARLRPALSERLRLPGALDRGRRRARAGAELEARDRGVRARPLRRQVPRGRGPVCRGAHARLEAAGP